MIKKRRIRFFLPLICIVNILFTGVSPALAADAAAVETVVAFTSDVHHNSTKDDASANRLKCFLEYVTTAYGKVDALGICGDLGIPSSERDPYWSYAQRVMDNVALLGIEGVYTTGNHEYKNGLFATTVNQTTKRYTRLGVGKAAKNYEIYCFGAASTTLEFTESDIAALSDYLKTVGKEKPVFILSHYPLHALTYREYGKKYTRDPINREKVIDLLNQYPNTFFIWGHNHSKNDPNYDFVQTQSVGGKDIHFVYAAAGSMTDPSENIYSGNITGKGLVALISADGKSVSLRYLDENHTPFAEWTTNTVQFELGDQRAAIRLPDTLLKPTSVYFPMVCFDANGKMLGVCGETQTISGDDPTVPLYYPPGVSEGAAASCTILAIDPVGFYPLSPAATW